MKNVIFAILSIAVAAQVGCDQDESDLEERMDGAYTFEDIKLLSSDEAESLPELARVQSDSDPALNDDEPFGFTATDHSEAGCWVTLHWCDDPNGGGSTCSFTNCGLLEAIGHCVDLIEDTC